MWRLGGGGGERGIGGGGRQILQMIMILSLSVIKIVKYCGQKYIAITCYQLTLVSYKVLSVILRSVHGNVQIHVLFEKLTATVALNFTRCHHKIIDNRHIITIHIQYTSFMINFNVDSN